MRPNLRLGFLVAFQFSLIDRLTLIRLITQERYKCLRVFKSRQNILLDPLFYLIPLEIPGIVIGVGSVLLVEMGLLLVLQVPADV